jgi:hypothetical protein
MSRAAYQDVIYRGQRGYSCAVTTSNLVVSRSEVDKGGVRDVAALCRREVKTPPYPPYLRFVFEVGCRIRGWRSGGVVAALLEEDFEDLNERYMLGF